MLAGGFTVLAWVVWAFGSVLLGGLGVAGHLGVATWRGRASVASLRARLMPGNS